MITRFAPAPTGFLHLGHVVNAIYVWGVARALGGDVLVRIEDHDRIRSQREYETAILDDLAWLGFLAQSAAVSRTWVPASAEPSATHPFIRQSDRSALYETALASLRERGLIYACECSRREIAAASSTSGAELRYPGTCANKALPERPGLALRVRVADTLERFDDGVHGLVEQRPYEQCGDLVVRDRDGNWTYQFAVVVDDMDQRITHVIRGDDLLASTGRQIQLARVLGRASPPRFAHHPLIMKTPTQKLSKADGDTSIRDLRASGVSAEAVLGRAAHAAGLVDAATPMTVDRLVGLPRISTLASRMDATPEGTS